MSPRAVRQQIEAELCRNVESAREVYEGLRAAYTRERELAAAASRTSTADGGLLFARCRQIHDALQLALDQYRIEINRLNRLVVDRAIPDNYEELLRRIQ